MSIKSQKKLSRWCVYEKILCVAILLGGFCGGAVATGGGVLISLPGAPAYREIIAAPEWMGSHNVMVCFGGGAPPRILSGACPLLSGGEAVVQLPDLLLPAAESGELKAALASEAALKLEMARGAAARMAGCKRQFYADVQGWINDHVNRGGPGCEETPVGEEDQEKLKRLAADCLRSRGLQASTNVMNDRIGQLMRGLITCTSLSKLQNNLSAALRKLGARGVSRGDGGAPVPPQATLRQVVPRYWAALKGAIEQFEWITPQQRESLVRAMNLVPIFWDTIVTFMLTNEPLQAVVHSEDLFLYMKTLDVRHAHSLRGKQVLPVLFSRRDVCGLCRAKLARAVSGASAGLLWHLEAPLLYLSQVPAGEKRKGKSPPDWILTGDGSELQPVPRADDAPGHIPGVCLLRRGNDAWIQSAEVLADGTLGRCTLSNGTVLFPPTQALPH